jgi:hypothetical protein
VTEDTVVIELSRSDAVRAFNFLEYATRTDADWRGYTKELGRVRGASLTGSGGRLEAEGIARAIAEVTGGGMSEHQHEA